MPIKVLSVGVLMTKYVTAICLAFVYLFSSTADAAESLDLRIVGTWHGIRERSGKCEFLAWNSTFLPDGRFEISFFANKKRTRLLQTDLGNWNTKDGKLELKVDGVRTPEVYLYTLIGDDTIKYVNPMKDLVVDCQANYEFIEHRAGKDSTSEEDWYPQRVTTADFGFSAEVDSDDNERYSVQAIRIIDRKTGDILQEIRDINGMDTWAQPNELISIVDANFDGHPDIVIPFADGGAGPNFTNYYYLFSPKSKRFEFNQQLSDLSQPSVNSDGTITSAYRSSCCQHHSETYRFHRGKLLLVADWDRVYTSDGKWIETTTRTLINGRWHTKFQRVPQNQKAD